MMQRSRCTLSRCLERVHRQRRECFNGFRGAVWDHSLAGPIGRERRSSSRMPEAVVSSRQHSTRAIHDTFSILKEPKGSWDREMWLRARHALLNLDDQSPLDAHGLQQAALLLERLLKETPSATSANYSVDTDLLNALLRSWLRAWKEGSDVEHILSPALLLQWVDTLSSKSPEARPNADTYRYLIDASLSHFPANDGQNSNEGAVLFIEGIFQRMRRALDPELTPELYDFHKVMYAFVKARQMDKAESYLRQLRRLYISSGYNPRFQPTADSFNVVMVGYSKQGAPREATKILESMIADGVAPSKAHFESCLNAWYRTAGQAVAGQRAEILLLQMQDLSHQGYDTAPCIRSVAKVVSCWAQSKRKDAAVRAEAVLRLMEGLDWASDIRHLVEAYLAVIRVYAHSGEKTAPEKCESLMSELQTQVGLANIPPTQLKKLYSCLILSWARSGRRDAADRAQAIFDRAQSACHEAGVAFEPDRFCYNSLLEAWAKVGDGHRAEAVWKSMHRSYRRGNQSCQPDTKSVNSVLLAWSRSKEVQASERAEAVFERLFGKDGDGSPKIDPDVVSFNAILSALGGSKDRERALRGEAYLGRLHQFYQKERKRSCRPTTVTFTKAIELWVEVGGIEALERSVALLKDMKEQRVKPSEHTLKAFSAIYEHSNHPSKESLASATLTALRNRVHHGL